MCIFMANSWSVLQKPTQLCKAIILQLKIKITMDFKSLSFKTHMYTQEERQNKRPTQNPFLSSVLFCIFITKKLKWPTETNLEPIFHQLMKTGGDRKAGVIHFTFMNLLGQPCDLASTSNLLVHYLDIHSKHLSNATNSKVNQRISEPYE